MLEMETGKFYLIIGVFFQQKNLTIAIYGQALMQTVIEHCVFSGVIATDHNMGALTDHYGSSNVFIKLLDNSEDNKRKLLFIKSYDKDPGVEIEYELYSDSDNGAWIGKWTHKDLGGLVKMNSIEITPEKYFNWKEAHSDLLKYIPEEEIPIKINDLDIENIPGYFNENKDEENTDSASYDDLPF